MLGKARRALGVLLRRFGIVAGKPVTAEISNRLAQTLGSLPPTITAPKWNDAKFFPIAPTRPGNWIVVGHNGSKKLRTRFIVRPGATGNIVVFGDGARRPEQIEFHGSNNLAVFGDDITWPLDVNLRFSSSGGLCAFGRACSSNGTTLVLEGDGTSILIGDDTMFAADTEVRNSDLHGIADQETGLWLNPPRDVTIERQVWIGLGALISKGVTIGENSVIGARALVSRDIPAGSIAAGVPAKVIRQGVRWTRDREP